MGLSKSQLDRLGERLRRAEGIEPADLMLLDEYRQSFALASESVVGRIRMSLGIEPTVRPAKSTQAIIDKLRREKSRLSRIQDIAGCRILVDSIVDQDRLLGSLRSMFPSVDLKDRRQTPSHGYRAVHLIVSDTDRWVEVQVRTELQHRWATLSEKLADVYGHEIKYGQGDQQLLEQLAGLSAMQAEIERAERLAEAYRRRVDGGDAALPQALNALREQLQHNVAAGKAAYQQWIRQLLAESGDER
ncbi:hypothetical protein J7U46_19700 [Pelomonas sp. V22]|uniref:hypothetical protein n=1 Tax=Pelomonas sp. V22 TaxID=2822139 RepID=UPI0024A84100|nr:hypothetical protein [Pelomonas sp. V22]MDI4635297.1 hypothetical protein [Pelomonas sp. V22]